MLTICASKPLNDKMVSLEKVSLPIMIQVRAGQRLDEEDLELYFESKRSGGAPIEDVTMLEDDRCAVIDYGDNNGQYQQTLLGISYRKEVLSLVLTDCQFPLFDAPIFLCTIINLCESLIQLLEMALNISQNLFTHQRHLLM